MLNFITRKPFQLMLGGVAAVALAVTAAGSTPSAVRADNGPQQPNIYLDPCVIGLAKPNLVVQDVRIGDDSKTLRVTYSNEGCATKTGFWITVIPDSHANVQYLWQPAMAKKQSLVRIVNLPASAQTPGSHYANVALDWHMGQGQSLIAESNEYDNFGDETYTVLN
jgi:hypothetical protein